MGVYGMCHCKVYSGVYTAYDTLCVTVYKLQ